MFGAAGHVPELIIILVIALLILGPGKLPQVGGALGKTIREFKRGSSEAEADEAAKDGAAKEPDKAPVSVPADAPAAAPAARTEEK